MNTPTPSNLARKQAKSEGGGFPQWLADLGLKPGQFYLETTPRIKAVMKDETWQDKARVWACLALHTMCFRQEFAVKLFRGSTVPLTRGDISSEVGIPPSRVYRALVELEDEGHLLRKPLDSSRGLLKGEITIHCYAIPRSAKKTDPAQLVSVELEYPEDLPPELIHWMRRLKVRSVPAGDALERAKRLCADLGKIEAELKQVLKPDSDSSDTLTGSSKPENQRTARGSGKNRLGSARGQFGIGAQPLPNKEDRKDIHTTEGERAGGRNSAATEDARPLAPSRFLEVKNAIIQTGLCAKLKRLPDDGIIGQVVTALRDGSAEGLKNRIHARFDDIRSLGILVELAADVASCESAGVPVAPEKKGSVESVKALAIENLKRTGRIFG